MLKMTFKTIVVEDEPLARKSLERLCGKSEKLELSGSFEGAESALVYLEKESIDLILLDVEMPSVSGLELMDKLPYLPQVIITSSKSEYAFEAFEYDVTDFLKKPVTKERFVKAIEKVLEREITLSRRLSSLSTTSAANELYVKSAGRYTRLPYDSILYFENVGDYVKVVTSDASFIIYGALKAIDAKLNYPRFLKVHRSFIVNLDKIVDIEDNSLVISKKMIPVSRAHKPILMNSLNIL